MGSLGIVIFLSGVPADLAIRGVENRERYTYDGSHKENLTGHHIECSRQEQQGVLVFLQPCQKPGPANKLADKPANVLTSHATFSGAEEFSYDLKMLRRATLIGETTGGGAHPGSWHRIDAHFGMGVPDGRPINPISKTDWEGTGVAPDINVSAADALTTAEKQAVSKLAQRP